MCRMAEAIDLSQQKHDEADVFEDSMESQGGDKEGSRGVKRNAMFSSSSSGDDSFSEAQKAKMKSDIIEEVRRMLREELREEIRTEMRETMREVIKDVMREAIREEMKTVVDVVRDVRGTVEKMEEKVGDVKAEVSKVTDDISVWKERVQKLEDRMIDQQARSRRNNLMFFGVKEEGGREDCEKMVRDIIKDIGVTGGVAIERAHRNPTGVRPAGSKPRPLVCKFLDFKDKEAVKKNAKKLPRHIYVGDDLPKEIREARKRLMPDLKKAQAEKKNAFIVFPARLIVDGVEVKAIRPGSVGEDDLQRTPANA